MADKPVANRFDCRGAQQPRWGNQKIRERFCPPVELREMATETVAICNDSTERLDSPTGGRKRIKVSNLVWRRWHKNPKSHSTKMEIAPMLGELTREKSSNMGAWSNAQMTRWSHGSARMKTPSILGELTEQKTSNMEWSITRVKVFASTQNKIELRERRHDQTSPPG